MLTPEEVGYYAARRRTIDSDASRSLSRNTFAKSQARADKTLGDATLKYQWDRTRDRLPGQYVNRGLARSGVYGQGIQDFNTQRGQAEQGLLRQFDREYGGLNLDWQDIEGQKKSATEMLLAEQQARTAEKAAQLRLMGS
jgi:hypothetical protein